MPATENEKVSYRTELRARRAAEVFHTFEWLIIAFVLVLFFRTFILEPYRIPTGSMADTLKGDHFRLRCLQCGYKYDFGFLPELYALAHNSNPKNALASAYSRCPSCGFYQQTSGTMPVVNGDRILVLKYIYQFIEPKRWDVIVFKNPLEPSTNYIKRLVALPGEIIEIIDGDIYINERIVRKPPKVQNELWMPVYDNDYQPVRPNQTEFNGHAWQQPFKNDANSNWTIQKNTSTIFRLDSPPNQIHTLVYDTSTGNNFRATYAYSDTIRYDYLPFCSDLKLSFYIESPKQIGSIGIALTKYRTLYKASVDFDGRMVIAKISDNEEKILTRKPVKQLIANKPVQVSFTIVDHQLILQFADEKLTYDLGRSPEDAGDRYTNIQPQAKIFGSGKMALSHVAVYRDVHYTNAQLPRNHKPSRATEGQPLELLENEFFVLGDNSPDSQDGRLWSQPGIGNNGQFYRRGIVPREYLVGKALFVYWPGGFRAFHNSRFAVIPDVSQVRFIYGGSNKDR
ncbi:MAG: signal peptidase I [Planctomycetes bacterium]|nr:signal peptidase I [Planctomycetota bacterium]